MAEIFVRVHSPLFFGHFSSTFLQVRLPIQFTTFKSLFCIKCSDPTYSITSQLQSLHIECSVSVHFVTFQLCSRHIGCPDFSYFVTFQLRPCHIECPDPGHGTKICVHALATSSVTVNIYCLRCIVDFIVLLLFGTDCVDSSGSLSGGAFNQLKLVTLSIV